MVGVPIGLFITLLLTVLAPAAPHWSVESPDCDRSVDGKFFLNATRERATVRGYAVCVNGYVAVADLNNLPLSPHDQGYAYSDPWTVVRLTADLDLVEVRLNYGGGVVEHFLPSDRVV